MSTKLILPLIHLGGSSPTTLLADYSAARTALADALALLQHTYHDRDYYLLGQTVHREARGQHIERCAAIGSVIVALRAMEEHALDEHDARQAARDARDGIARAWLDADADDHHARQP